MNVRPHKEGFNQLLWGWLGEAKVSCIYITSGVQLILAYSWARPAVLVAGKRVKGEDFYFFCFFTFIHFPFSLVPLFHSSTISLLPFSGRRHKMIHKG